MVLVFRLSLSSTVFALAAIDALLLAVAVYAGKFLRFADAERCTEELYHHAPDTAIFVGVFLLTMHALGVYRQESLADMTAAHRVYARLGYTRAPDRDWDPVPGVHLIAFSKEL